MFSKKNPVFNANSVDPDQMPQNADLGLHCLPVTLLAVSRLKWVKEDKKEIKNRKEKYHLYIICFFFFFFFTILKVKL